MSPLCVVWCVVCGVWCVVRGVWWCLVCDMVWKVQIQTKGCAIEKHWGGKEQKVDR